MFLFARNDPFECLTKLYCCGLMVAWGEDMHKDILAQLARITPEEENLLNGSLTIDRDLYMIGTENTIYAEKLLSTGKLIDIRPHTRFCDFPEHAHNYVEIVYVCQGTATHIVNGKKIVLKQGDLLFLNQGAIHKVCRAEKEDIAVNFIVLPEFFSAPLSMIGEEQTPLRKFLVECLYGDVAGTGYLHFEVSQIYPVQNIVENLLWILIENTPNKRKIVQTTMGLLLMQLLVNTNALTTENEDDAVIWETLRYVETNYPHGTFAGLVEQLHYDPSWLSRKIKQKTGKTFTQLIQDKRMSQSAFLLKNTTNTISEVSVLVGYENVSYFHRHFAKVFGCSPKQYRKKS